VTSVYQGYVAAINSRLVLGTRLAVAEQSSIRELKHVGRQHDDDGQNKFLQINDSKENLSYIITRMNLIQYKKLKTLALCLGRVLLTKF
jgi:hypothetical protein